MPQHNSIILDPAIRRAIAAKQRALILTGNFDDLDERIHYRRHALLQALHDEGYLVITFSLSAGGQLFKLSALADDERTELESHLNTFHIPQLFKGHRERNTSDELADIFRTFTRLLQTPSPKRRICLVLYYLEHLAPRNETPGTTAEGALVVSECLHSLCGSAALKKSGNLVIGIGRQGLYSDLLAELPTIEYPFADETLAKSFIDRTLKQHTDAAPILGDGLNPKAFARIAAGMKVLDLQSAIDQALGNRTPITTESFSALKCERLINNSEGTLRFVTPEIGSFDEIIGLTEVIAYFKKVLVPKMRIFAPSVPRMIILSGPAGTGKSILASILAREAGWALFEFGLTKNMYVGESERRQQLALSIAESAQPVVLLWDEIESFGDRAAGGTQGDNVTGSLVSNFLSWSARESHRGKVLIIGTCNLPQNLDFALLSRAEVIPVLPLKRNDIPQLFPAFEKRITNSRTLDPSDPKLLEAAANLYAKDASNRHIYHLMCRCALKANNDRITADLILNESRHFVGNGERYSTAIAALLSLRYSSFADLWPHYDDAEVPWWLDGLFQEGRLDLAALEARIREYQAMSRAS